MGMLGKKELSVRSNHDKPTKTCHFTFQTFRITAIRRWSFQKVSNKDDADQSVRPSAKNGHLQSTTVISQFVME